MTARAGIIAFLVTSLTGAGFVYVTRRRLTSGEIAGGQFPAAVIIGGAEDCKQISLNVHTAEGTWIVDLNLHVKAEDGDAQGEWEDKAAAAVRAVATDHTMGGLAVMTEVVAKNPDPGVFAPWASGTVRLRIKYRYNELTQGG